MRYLTTLAIAAIAATSAAASPNLVTNGDFEAGNTGFTSEYDYFDYAANPGLDMGEAKYTVATNAVLPHHLFTSFADHTSGAGNYMVVNGSSLAGTVVWTQTLFVTTDTNYNFSAWLASVYAASPASLQMVVTSFTASRSTLPSFGDTVLGTFAASGTPRAWNNITASFNSGSASMINISFVNQNTDLDGNDFGLDDISLSLAVPEPATWALMIGGFGLVGIAARRRRRGAVAA